MYTPHPTDVGVDDLFCPPKVVCNYIFSFDSGQRGGWRTGRPVPWMDSYDTRGTTIPATTTTRPVSVPTPSPTSISPLRGAFLTGRGRGGDPCPSEATREPTRTLYRRPTGPPPSLRSSNETRRPVNVNHTYLSACTDDGRYPRSSLGPDRDSG